VHNKDKNDISQERTPNKLVHVVGPITPYFLIIHIITTMLAMKKKKRVARRRQCTLNPSSNSMPHPSGTSSP
jgi:hypothetical protein